MAGGEDVMSDASDKSSSDYQFMKCCTTKTCKIKVCVRCFSIYHRGCITRFPNVTKLSGDKILCCNANQQVEVSNQDPEKKNLIQQVRFLQQILDEVRDKNRILQLNNNLLLDKIETLENNENKKNYVNRVKKQNENLQKPSLYSRITRSAINRQVASIPTLQVPVRSNVHTNVNRENEVSVNVNNIDVNNQQPSNNEPINEEENDFTIVTYKKKRPKKNLGTAEVSEDERKHGFSGAERKVWLYINRVNRVATEKQILDYIVKKPGFDERNTNVEEIPSGEGQLKRFLVTAPLDKKDIMYRLEFWPKNVGVKRFNFEKNKKFLAERSGNFQTSSQMS